MISTAMPEYQTPPQLARRWKCKPATVVALIRSGELEAFNLARAACTRPRYRISAEAIASFEERRAARFATKGKLVRSRKLEGNVKSFV
jgi:hypothetical protein